MRNKNLEGERKGEVWFIHPPRHVAGKSFSIASAVRKPPVPWVVPIAELPSVSGNIFPIAQHMKGPFDLAALSYSVKYRFGKIPGASR